MTDEDLEIFEADAKKENYIRNQLEKKFGDPKNE